MAYAGTTGTARGGTASTGTDQEREPEAPDRIPPARGARRRSATARQRPAGRSYTRRPELREIGTFGVALALGALIGAGVALLTAPQSGQETRAVLTAGRRRVGNRANLVWDALREELRFATRRGRRRVRHGVTRGRWAAEDLLD